MRSISFLYGIVGLLAGLAIGFFAANNLNQKEAAPLNTIGGDSTQMNQQVRNEVVRDQSADSSVMPEIMETLERAKNEPDNYDAQIAAGDLYLKIQNYPKAIEFYESGYKQNPQDYDLIVKIGNTFYDSKQFESAADWYAKALEKKPEDFAVRTDFGVTFVERPAPDLPRAIEEFKRSLASNSKHEPTIYNLTVAYLRAGDLDQARKHAKLLNEVNPNGELNAKIKDLLK